IAISVAIVQGRAAMSYGIPVGRSDGVREKIWLEPDSWRVAITSLARGKIPCERTINRPVVGAAPSEALEPTRTRPPSGRDAIVAALDAVERSPHAGRQSPIGAQRGSRARLAGAPNDVRGPERQPASPRVRA